MIQTPISMTHWLDAPAAASYLRMRSAGCPAGITEAGRTYAQQVELYRRYLAGLLVATAAKPGTSNHEKGNALDLPEPARTWVRAHGAEYGWIKDRVPREPWHIEYLAGHDTHPVANIITTGGTVAPTPAPVPIAAITPLAAPVQEDDMLIIESPGALSTLQGDTLAGLGTTAQADRLTAKGVQRVIYDAAEFARLRQATAGRELIHEPTRGYAVGTPGGLYRGLGDLTEVQYHQDAGCRDRDVSAQTFDNLTAH